MITFTRPLAIAAGTLTAAGAALAVTLAAHGAAAPAEQQPGSHTATTAVSGQQAGPVTAANPAGTSGSTGTSGSVSGTGGTGTNGTGSTGTGGTGTNGTGGGTNGTGGTGGGGGGVKSICQLDPSVCVNVQRLPVALPVTDPSPSPSPLLPPPTYCQLHPTLTICRP